MRKINCNMGDKLHILMGLIMMVCSLVIGGKIAQIIAEDNGYDE